MNRRFRYVATRIVAVTVCVSGLTFGVQVNAQPANPSDSAIAEAEQAVSEGNGDVSRLVTSISEKDAEVIRLENEMGGLREAVNKALVDLHDAQYTAEQARQASRSAREQLSNTQVDLADAQAILDEISRVAYRRGATAPGVSAAAGKLTSDDALDRQTFIRMNAEQQREAIERLERLRTQKANEDSSLRKARTDAEQLEAQAATAREEAQANIERSSGLLQSLQQQRADLIAQRSDAEHRLAIARADADDLGRQRQEYEAFLQAEEERKAAQDRAAAAREEADAKAAEQQEKEQQAQQAAAEVREVETQIEAADTTSTQPTSAESAPTESTQSTTSAAPTSTKSAPAESAAESIPESEPATTPEADLIAEREAAQQRAEEAAAEAEAAKQQAEQEAAYADEAEDLQRQALEAAERAAQVIIQLGTPEHQSLDNPYPSDEEADDAFTYASESDGSYQALSDTASQQVSGSAAEKIELVINRAMSQIGTPYAWGGGDASGPTLGIRDGGVADSYGDYNKVGFDCSGLVLYAFAGVGISLPHYTGYQYQHGRKIDPSEMQRGDLIFYGPTAEHHVAIYLGDGTMLEAPQSGSTVQVSPVRWSGMSPYAVRLIE